MTVRQTTSLEQETKFNLEPEQVRKYALRGRHTHEVPWI